MARRRHIVLYNKNEKAKFAQFVRAYVMSERSMVQDLFGL
mgnify:CR=1 FL=1